jgi:superfamily II DNA or RNA helicase
MRAGAVGINLTQANRVFLMEPCLSPALELQAIGRVHRLGQKRNVEIVRLVMKDSVETRIQKMLKKKYSDGSSAANDEVVAAGGRKNRRAAAPALVGSIASDRTAVLGAEFDILFGVANTSDGDAMEVEPDAEDNSTGETAVEPDAATSVHV